MGWQIKAILFTLIFLAACSNNVNRGLYEGFKSQNDGYKTPNERVTSPPAPSYDVYKKERDRLKEGESATDKFSTQ